MKRVLFIGHDASRTGAPLVLLYFLRWLKNYSRHLEADLLLLSGGELETEYLEAVNEIMSLPVHKKPGPIRRRLSFLKKDSLERALPPSFYDYDVVVGNTVISTGHLRKFKERGIKTVCWLHELDYSIDVLIGTEKFLEHRSYIDNFIVGSMAVETMLRRLGIETKIDVVYEFSETADQTVFDVEKIKAEAGIPADAFVVGGCGTLEWRKGTDMFLQAAFRLSRANPDIYFLWIYGENEREGLGYKQMRHDLRLLGLSKKAKFIATRDKPHRFFAAMDLFALTSREDPFPLVCLEAASMGKPIICFENAGGAPEFVETDAGAVVSYGDIEALCLTILDFHNDRDKLARAGSVARQKIEQEFSLESSCRKLEKILLTEF